VLTLGLPGTARLRPSRVSATSANVSISTVISARMRPATMTANGSQLLRGVPRGDQRYSRVASAVVSVLGRGVRGTALRNGFSEGGGLPRPVSPALALGAPVPPETWAIQRGQWTNAGSRQYSRCS
jgi:hypothetical protein